MVNPNGKRSFNFTLTNNFFEKNCIKIVKENGKITYSTELVKEDIIGIFNDFIALVRRDYEDGEKIVKTMFRKRLKAYNFLKEVGNIIEMKKKLEEIKKGIKV
jgi:hypothetical protein